MARVRYEHFSHILVFCMFIVVLRAPGPAAGAVVCSRSNLKYESCTCSKSALNRTNVLCTNVSSIPDGFPSDVSNIQLYSNTITEVRKGPFNFLEQLLGIYLRHNYISYIEAGAFGGLMQVEIIDLSYNYIRSIGRDVFSHLPVLQTIYLGHNLIATIDRYAFFFLPSIGIMLMPSNNVTCGCEEKVLAEFLALGSLDLVAECSNFGDTPINQVDPNQWSTVPSCSGETLFRPQSSRSCYVCSDAKGLKDCQKDQNLQQCYGEEMELNSTDAYMVLCTRSANISCWNDEVTLKNEAHAEQMIPVIAMMILFMVAGLPGNSVVIFMYHAKKQRTSANTFILFLACIDLFACVAIHPYVTYKIFNFYNQTWTAVCKFFEFLVHLNLLLSGLTLMLISVDRFLAICKPVKYLKFDQHIMKSIAATSLISIIASIPILEFYGASPTKFDNSNTIFIGYSCHYQKKYIGSMAMGLFSAFIVSGFLVVIIAMTILYKSVAVVAYKSRRRVGPLSNAHTLAGFNTKATNNSNCSSKSNPSCEVIQLVDVSSTSLPSSNITTIVRSPRQTGNCAGQLNTTSFCVTSSNETSPRRKTGNTRDRYTVNAVSSNPHPQLSSQLAARRLKAAKILFLVTFVFFLSWMPFFILRLCNFFSKDRCHPTSYVGEVLDTMLNHVFYINNAINPILYTIINKTFRQECRKSLKKRFRRNL